MPNMKSVIQNHNNNLLSKQTTPVAGRSCSCPQKSECPLNNDESDNNDDEFEFFFSQIVFLDLSKPGTSKNEKSTRILGPKEKETSLMQLKIIFLRKTDTRLKLSTENRFWKSFVLKL